MSDKNGGDTNVAEDTGDLGTHLNAQGGVERGERFVEEQDLWLRCERASERHALLLAAGQCAGHPVAVVGEIDEFEQLGNASSDLRFAELLASCSESEHDVLADTQVREERSVLENHADIALFGLDPRALGRRRRIWTGACGAPANDNLAGRWLFEAGDRAEEGRLAATGWSKERND